MRFFPWPRGRMVKAAELQQSFQKVYPHLGNLVGLPPELKFF